MQEPNTLGMALGELIVFGLVIIFLCVVVQAAVKYLLDDKISGVSLGVDWTYVLPKDSVAVRKAEKMLQSAARGGCPSSTLIMLLTSDNSRNKKAHILKTYVTAPWHDIHSAIEMYITYGHRCILVDKRK
jgi:hypothetical protein